MRREPCSVIALMANRPWAVVSSGSRVIALVKPSGASVFRSPSTPMYRSSRFSRTTTKSMASGFLSGLRNPGRQRAGRTLAYVCLPQRRYPIPPVVPLVEPKRVESERSMASRSARSNPFREPYCCTPCSPDGNSVKRRSNAKFFRISTVGAIASGAASSPGITTTRFAILLSSLFAQPHITIVLTRNDFSKNGRQPCTGRARDVRGQAVHSRIG